MPASSSSRALALLALRSGGRGCWLNGCLTAAAIPGLERFLTTTTTPTEEEAARGAPPGRSAPSRGSSSGSGKEGKGKEEDGAEPCDHKHAAAGRVVTPELDRQGYMPEGMGMDPAEQGTWLKPGEDGGAQKFWDGRGTKQAVERGGGGRQAAEAVEKERGAGMVEDKLTGERLRDTDVLADRRAE